MKNLPIMQGGLDSLCGVYSICNAYRITRGASDDDVGALFEKIISYLSKKKMLKSILLGGMYHKNMTDIILNCVGEEFFEKLSNFKWANYDMDAFWRYSVSYLSNPSSAIIISIGGRANHYSVIKRMTEKTMFLFDSSGIQRINKSSCRFYGYEKTDKYIIYPNQCWFLKGVSSEQ